MAKKAKPNGRKSVPALRKGRQAHSDGNARGAGRAGKATADTGGATPRNLADLAAGTRSGQHIAVMVACPGYFAKGVSQIKGGGCIVQFVPLKGTTMPAPVLEEPATRDAGARPAVRSQVAEDELDFG